MSFSELHYDWHWQFHAAPDDLWPLVADTNRFNRDAGIPTVRDVSDERTSGRNGRRRLRLTQMGVPVEWEEEPFQWVEPETFGVTRRYTRGPVAEMRVLVELAPLAPSGTEVRYQVWARPRNLLGLAAIRFEIGWRRRRRFAAVFRGYDARVGRPDEERSTFNVQRSTTFDRPDGAEGKSRVMQHVPPGIGPFAGSIRLVAGAGVRLRTMRETLVGEGSEPGLVDRLIDTVEHGDDVLVARLRPYVLADAWGAPRREVLELCLRATRAGLLGFRWDLLCPSCRGAKQTGATLREIGSTVHCESCNIDTTVNFDRLVELTFRVNEAIRVVEVGEFCVGGPRVTPHIVIQQLLPPGAGRTVMGPGSPGRYRVRTRDMPSGQLVTVAEVGAAEATLVAWDEGWSHEEVTVGPAARLDLRNHTAREQLFIVERMAWTEGAVTAAEVTALQTFRDLFATEALRPGEEIAVGSLTVLFTDLRGSTRFYREIGDAVAFGRVMDHFAVLRETVADEGGAVVKTIGDAVMAAFPRPVGALRAALRAQAELAAPSGGVAPLHLKVGIHTGPCIAVTLNDRLDYFGSTVNIAARLESQSSGADVVISDAVRRDPEVAAILDAGLCDALSLEGTLKGFEGETFLLWRVRNRTSTQEVLPCPEASVRSSASLRSGCSAPS